MTYPPKGINPDYTPKGIAALRSAADTVEALAIGERSDAIITLLARLCERVAMGTACQDEVEALVRLVRG